MVAILPAVEVVGSYFDERFQPHVPVLRLSWEQDSEEAQLWELPEGVCMTGPAPEQFGFSVERRRADAYTARLVWNHSCLTWADLTKAQLLTSDLAPLLQTLGTDLYTLLDQPIRHERTQPQRAA